MIQDSAELKVQEGKEKDYTKAHGLQENMPRIARHLKLFELSNFELGFGKTWQGATEDWYQTLYRKCFRRRDLAGVSFKHSFREAILEVLAILKREHGGIEISADEFLTAAMGNWDAPSMDALIQLEYEIHLERFRPVPYGPKGHSEELLRRRKTLEKKKCLLAIQHSYSSNDDLMEYTPSPLFSTISKKDLAEALEQIISLEEVMQAVPEADLRAVWRRIPNAAHGFLGEGSPSKERLVQILCSLPEPLLAELLAQAGQGFSALAFLLMKENPRIFIASTPLEVVLITASLYRFRKEYGLLEKLFKERNEIQWHKDYAYPLVFYSAFGVLETVKQLLTMEPSKAMLGLALHKAAGNRRTEIVQELLKAYLKDKQEQQYFDVRDLSSSLGMFFEQEVSIDARDPFIPGLFLYKQVKRWQQPLLKEWEMLTISNMEHVPPDVLVNTLNAFGRLGIQPSNDFLKAWFYAATDKIFDFSTQALATSIYALRKFNISDDYDFFSYWGGAATGKIWDFSSQELTNIISALAELYQKPPLSFLDIWLEAVIKKIKADDFNEQQLVNTIYAFNAFSVNPDISLLKIWVDFNRQVQEKRSYLPSIRQCFLL